MSPMRAPEPRNPYVQQWSFGIERQISSRTSFETRYVGNHVVGGYRAFDLAVDVIAGSFRIHIYLPYEPSPISERLLVQVSMMA